MQFRKDRVAPAVTIGLLALATGAFYASSIIEVDAEEFVPFADEKVEASRLEVFRNATVERLKETEHCSAALPVCEYRDVEHSVYFFTTKAGTAAYPAVAIARLDIHRPFFKGMGVAGYYSGDEAAYRSFLEYAEKRSMEIYEAIDLSSEVGSGE